jgi:hypothetical protein
MSDNKLTIPRWVEISAIILLLGIAWFLRSKDLDKFKLTDETKWGFRSANFTLALHRGDYAFTFQRSHPGVTTMWAGSIGMKFAIPDYVDRTSEYIENTSYKMDLNKAGLEVMQIIVPGRQVVIAINMIILITCYLYLRRLVGSLGAFISTVLLAFEPFYIGHTRILHVDGFLSIFMYLSVITFLSFSKHGRIFDLILSGVAAGLTWLTKTPGFILAAGILVIAFINWISDIEGRSLRIIWNSLYKNFKPLVIWGFIGGFTLVLLWPAMWVQPIYVLKLLLRDSLEYAVQGHTSPVFFNGIIYRDGIVPAKIWYYYPLAYLWRVSPVVLLGLIIALFEYIYKVDRFQDQGHRKISLSLFLLAIGFMVFMSVGSKRSDRYVLPVFPALSVIAGMGWASLYEWLGRFRPMRMWRAVGSVIVGIPIFVHTLLPLIYSPYYLSYFNPLMGGARKAPEVLQIGWGEGLDEAARYLNSMPGAEDMVVASWYERVFSDFFVGGTLNIEDFPEIGDGEIQAILAADYIVIYYHQFQRGMPEDLLAILEDKSPIHQIWINGLEYIRIYKPSTFMIPEVVQ